MAAESLGLSFSLLRCRELNINPQRLLRSSLRDLGCKKFRLMSYWSIHESTPNKYNFRELDWQMNMVAEYGGAVSLCIGKRQPRWPECHMPEWAVHLPPEEWQKALFRFIRLVVLRYKNHPALASWQLENEALLKSFGICTDGDFSRKRLRREASLVRVLDSSHPLIMTLSDSWGLPFRSPRADSHALTIYRQVMDGRGRVKRSNHRAFSYNMRGTAVRLISHKPTFIHELQGEPWTNGPLLNTPLDQQLELFDAKTLNQNVQFARDSKLKPIYLWGLEWWYWLKVKQQYSNLWEEAGKIFWDNSKP